MIKQIKSWLRPIKETLLSKLRRRKLKQTLLHINANKITAGLTELGVKPNDVIMVYSSLKSLGYVEGGPNQVVRALLDTVNHKGTLVLPTFFMPGGSIKSACEEKDTYIFDPKKHPSGLGRIPNAFLAQPGIKRSIHPTHSVAALGKHADYITQAHLLSPTIFGIDSPWGRMLNVDAKIVGLGVSLAPVTWYHMLEDELKDQFPLQVHLKQSHKLRCLTQDEGIVEVPVIPFDPQYNSRRIDHPSRDDLRAYFWNLFSEKPWFNYHSIGLAVVWLADANAFYQYLKQLAQEGLTIYSTKKEIQEHQALSKAP